jgi:hypothetical protein
VTLFGGVGGGGGGGRAAPPVQRRNDKAKRYTAFGCGPVAQLSKSSRLKESPKPAKPARALQGTARSHKIFSLFRPPVKVTTRGDKED